MSTFAIQKRQALTRLQKEKRKFRATELLDEITSGLTGEIVWSDEKIFYSGTNSQQEK